MSFANIDLEAQKSIRNGKIISGHETQTKTQNELDIVINNTANQLQVFGNLISQFETQRKNIGTKRDNQHLRNSLDSLTDKLNDLEQALKNLVASLLEIINRNLNENLDAKFEITNRQIIITERLLTEYNELHQQYSKSFKQYIEKKKAISMKVSETSPLLEESESQLRASQYQIQQQTQLQDQDIINETELQYHRLLTEERNREIEQAHQGIREVNSIFKDLGQLVRQQGDQLDLVEDNIAQLQSNTQQGSRELSKAHEYQKKKGKFTCIILVALCIFILVIVLAVIS